MQKAILPVMDCSCEKNRPTKFVCVDHNEILCLECKRTSHLECRTFSIEEHNQSCSRTALKATYERAKVIESKAEDLWKRQLKSIEIFQRMENECEKEINAFRKRLHTFIDEIADETLGELVNNSHTYSCELYKRVRTTRNIVQRLQNDQKIMLDALSSGDVSHMIESNMTLAREYQDFENLFGEVEKDCMVENISFQPHKVWTTLLNNKRTLGTTELKEIPAACYVPNALPVPTASEDKNASKTINDAQQITGSTFMPSGDLLLCDHGAKSLKLLSPAFVEKSNLQLSEQPWDASVINDSTAVISLPYAKKLQFIETSPSLKPKQWLNTDRKCYGLDTVDDLIFVSFMNSPGKGEVHAFDMNGNSKQKIDVHQEGMARWSLPAYISVCRSGETIYISDYVSNEVIRMTTDGKTEFRYCDPESNFRGMTADEQKNIYVCDEAKRCIFAITENGANKTTFLKIPYEDAKPTSISYRESDHTLIVTCYKRLVVYKFRQLVISE